MEVAAVMSRHRLHSICPYFAMFPESFVREQVNRYTRKGDYVFDPFSGRGTTLFESLLNGRHAAASDINPVAYCLTRAKSAPPTLRAVTLRIRRLARDFEQHDAEDSPRSLHPFFRRAFHYSTLRQLLFLRRRLRWRDDAVDGFIAAVVIGSLHGEMDRSPSYFSNQMPRTICLKPDYSLAYWKRHGLFPKKRDVFEMLLIKVDFRLRDGRAMLSGHVAETDARQAAERFPELTGAVRLVVTSPPYLDVTRFEEDQWLRLWFLGGPPSPTYGRVSTDDRHTSPERYWKFLSQVWRGLAPLLQQDAIVVMRIGTQTLPLERLQAGLLGSLRSAFPAGKWLRRPRLSKIVGRQARAFNPTAAGCRFEADFVYCPAG
jgi:hypothetical protein